MSRPSCFLAVIPFLSATFTALAAPVIQPGGIVNVANYKPDISPGVILAIFGSDLAPSTSLTSAFPMPTTLAGVRVELVEGNTSRPIPLFFVSPGQINALLPYDVKGTMAQLRVRSGTALSAPETFILTPRAPRLLTKTMDGLGEAILLHASYTVVSAAAPARAGEVVILYLVGLGAVSPPVTAGTAAGDGGANGPLSQLTAEVTASVDGRPAKVLFAGLAPYFAGLYQLNLQLPDDLTGGPNTITVACGGERSQTGITFPAELATTPLATVSIGVSGGAATAPGASLTVPSGAFAGPASITVSQVTSGAGPGPNKGSAVYSFTGLPATTAKPIELALDFLPGAVPTGNTPYIVIRRPGASDAYLPARIESGRAFGTLPATAALLTATFAPPSAVPQSPAPQSATLQPAAPHPAASQPVPPHPAEPPSLAPHLASSQPTSPNLGSLKAAVLDLAEPPSLVSHPTAPHPAEPQSPTADEILAFLLFSVSTHTTTNFEIVWTAGFDILQAAELGRALEDDLAQLKSIGFAWDTATKGRILVDWKDAWDYSPCGGTIRKDSWGPGFRMVLHRDVLPDPDRPFTSEMYAGHLLMHFLQRQYLPAGSVNPVAWAWMDEATATSYDHAHRHYPNVAHTWWNFAPRGVEYSAQSTDFATLASHGAGASRFLDFLTKGVSGQQLLADVYKARLATGAGLIPIRALPLNLNVKNEWLKFAQQEGTKLFAEYDVHWEFAIAGRRATVRGTVNERASQSWTAPMLSAQIFEFVLPATWPQGATALITVSGGPEIQALYYAGSDLGSATRFAEGQTLERKDVTSASFPGAKLWVVVVNQRADNPFKATTSVEIAFEVKPPAADLLQILRSCVDVSVNLTVKAKCEQLGSNKPPYDCYVGQDTHNRDPWGTSLPDLPITWKGNDFDINGEFRDANSKIRIEISGTLVVDANDPKMSKLINGKVKRSDEWTDSLTEWGFQFTELIFGRDPDPTNYYFSFTQPASELPRVVGNSVFYNTYGLNPTKKLSQRLVPGSATFTSTLYFFWHRSAK